MSSSTRSSDAKLNTEAKTPLHQQSDQQYHNGSTEPNGHRESIPGSSAKKAGMRTLTEAQLEKKRANDREAQRAIRERTKKQIEGLEQKIRDLESGEAFRQLQEALKQKDAIELENMELKRRLGQVLDVVRPFMGLLSPAHPYETQSLGFGAPTVTQEQRAVVTASDALNQRYEPSQANLPNGIAQNNATTNSLASVDAYRRQLSLGAPWERSNQGQTPGQYLASGDLERPPKRSRLEYEPTTSHPSPPTSATQQRSPNGASLATQLPANINPTCRLDTILFDFATSARRRIADGVPIHEVLGPEYPALNGVVDPGSAVMQYHPLSELLTEILKGFSAISGLPEKIAVIAGMFYVMRWYIAPSSETYSTLPALHVPTEEQLRVPHPIWIDYIPWPKMRSKMVYHYPQLPLDNFFYPYTTTLSLGFKSTELNACLYRDQNDAMRVHPDLEAHWRKVDSWTVGPYFAEMLPMLADSCAIRSEGKGHPD